MEELFRSLPWWVKWVAIPVLVLVVFGSLIIHLLGIVIGVLFKVLVFAVLVGALVCVVKKFSSSSSRRDR